MFALFGQGSHVFSAVFQYLICVPFLYPRMRLRPHKYKMATVIRQDTRKNRNQMLAVLTVCHLTRLLHRRNIKWYVHHELTFQCRLCSQNHTKIKVSSLPGLARVDCFWWGKGGGRGFSCGRTGIESRRGDNWVISLCYAHECSVL